ncbi:hypothetical protein [Marinicellulosiphila megalodicopiae]|uniref:hypothetical protein n=1 Tax=Marinicellulosiphila megalodicopiae TaxID=2724896 RepID=UPI003BAE1768
MIDDLYQGPMMTYPNEEGLVSFIFTESELIQFINLLTTALNNLTKEKLSDENILNYQLESDFGDISFDWLIISTDDQQTSRLHQKISLGLVDICKKSVLIGPIITCEFGWDEAILIGTKHQILGLIESLKNINKHTKKTKVCNETVAERLIENFPSADSEVKINRFLITNDEQQTSRIYYKLRSATSFEQ